MSYYYPGLTQLAGRECQYCHELVNIFATGPVHSCRPGVNGWRCSCGTLMLRGEAHDCAVERQSKNMERILVALERIASAMEVK